MNQDVYIKIGVVGNESDARHQVSLLCSDAHTGISYGVECFEVDEPEELVVKRPDVIVQTVDCTDLDESLVLTPQLIDMHQKLVLALYNYDKLLATNHRLDYEKMAQLMGVQAVCVDVHSGSGIELLMKKIVAAYEGVENASRHIHVEYGMDVERAIDSMVAMLKDIPNISDVFSKRYLSIRLLEREELALTLLKDAPNLAAVEACAQRNRIRLKKELHKQPSDVIHEARHGFISGALKATLQHSEDDSDHTRQQKIDAILTHKWLGFPILVAVLYLVFECTFTLGAFPQEWISDGVEKLCGLLRGVLPMGWFSSMLVDGIVQGVGAVLSFLPNIVILFFFISLMEDSGYMSRAAFLMDKIMHKVGLHGKSFIPMLVGFGCNVPAIMAARSIDNKKDRTLTMLMIPFMSCGARLPVYMLLVSAFFARCKALVMMSLYLAGIVLSILFALVMKRTKYFRKPTEDYVSELPAFRCPTFRNTGLHIWERCADYLKKISTVILAASVIIWALEYFPRHENMTAQEQQENSCLASIGKWLSPATAPLGFDWKMNVCILTGLPAKEAIVSTMGILYHDEDAVSLSASDCGADEESTLVKTLRSEAVFTPITAYAFMLFVLLYFPCIATVATLRREIGRGWAAFTVVHSLALAWVVAFLVNQIGSLF